MPKIPENFDGSAFMKKFNVDLYGFTVKHGKLFVPSMPDLTDMDIADCVINPDLSLPISFDEFMAAFAEQEIRGNKDALRNILAKWEKRHYE